MPSDRIPLTQARLKELLRYDPETGVFTRTKQVSGRPSPHWSGVGAINFGGYHWIGIDGRRYLSHRLAFLYMEGEFPPDEVDHINRVRDDNRWINLRKATHRQNRANTSTPSNNTSGVRGVGWHKLRKSWRAYTTVGDKQVHLGNHATRELAAAAVDDWRRKNHGEFACNPNPDPLPRSPNPES